MCKWWYRFRRSQIEIMKNCSTFRWEKTWKREWRGAINNDAPTNRRKKTGLCLAKHKTLEESSVSGVFFIHLIWPQNIRFSDSKSFWWFFLFFSKRRWNIMFVQRKLEKKSINFYMCTQIHLWRKYSSILLAINRNVIGFAAAWVANHISCYGKFPTHLIFIHHGERNERKKGPYISLSFSIRYKWHVFGLPQMNSDVASTTRMMRRPVILLVQILSSQLSTLKF